MAKVYERITLGDYLNKIKFEKKKYGRVSIVLHPDEICRAYGPKNDHVHWQNVIDSMNRVDKKADDGLLLSNYFVDFYNEIKSPAEGYNVLILYLGDYWNGSC